MSETAWFCESCDAAGYVEIDDMADVWSGARLIYDTHRADSPKCGGEPRVIVRPIATEETTHHE